MIYDTGNEIKMRILLVRHGETSWNVDGVRFRGQVDIGLSVFGQQQAEAVGRMLQEEAIEVIYHSPMVRTRQTAERIQQHQGSSQLIEEPLLIDIDFGDWQGQLHSEIFAANPGTEEAWHKFPHELVFPNGESWYRVYERINLLFKRLRKQELDCVVLVTHGVVIRIILLYLLGLSPEHFWDFQIETCSLSEISLEPDGVFKIVKTNDTHHLSKNE
ncbi:MAG: hypothetical protein GF308_13350 [Candidatus Heimdallarchaeota archaeon]|nr:hypothetical protein [Candidatus Heimdallarchaeota archaeon]